MQKCIARSGLLFFLMALTPQKVQPQAAPQFVISGQIKDAVTKLPLQSVNVFLANTTLGSITDADGRYTIRGVPVGTHELVASLLGYEVQKISVRITTVDAGVNLRLQPTALEMPQVEVTAAPDREWRKNLKKFEEIFWGNRYEAKEYKILNPEVLDFKIEKESGCFIATASQPLRLENLRLGYCAEFIVQEFRYYLNQQEIKFAFIPRFEEMTPSNFDEAQKWKANRREAYLGSFRHFLASVISGRLTPEGYEATILPNLPWERNEKRFNRKISDFAGMLSPTAFPTEIEFNFQGTLQNSSREHNESRSLLSLRASRRFRPCAGKYVCRVSSGVGDGRRDVRAGHSTNRG